MTPEFWCGRRVLVTGHTGFKGAWLCAWLDRLGAKVTGLSHAPETEPNLWTLLGLDGVHSLIGDINDPAALKTALRDDPEVVFHFAAQSLVVPSYERPVETFMTNVVGVVSLLDAVARTPSVRSVVVATSDKCYENSEKEEPFVEGDPFGGHDPYSASKGCAEIAVASMRRSFFLPGAATGHPAGVASVRAGNVIGGGDWSANRLVPDIIRGCLGGAGEVVLRAPSSVRPWQHVLEPLHGYIILAERLFADPLGFASGYNFGPNREDERTVGDIANAIVGALGRGRVVERPDPGAPKEANVLRLDASRAKNHLGWRPLLGLAQAARLTAGWYADWNDGANASDITVAQIENYMETAARKGVI